MHRAWSDSRVPRPAPKRLTELWPGRRSESAASTGFGRPATAQRLLGVATQERVRRPSDRSWSVHCSRPGHSPDLHLGPGRARWRVVAQRTVTGESTPAAEGDTGQRGGQRVDQAPGGAREVGAAAVRPDEAAHEGGVDGAALVVAGRAGRGQVTGADVQHRAHQRARRRGVPVTEDVPQLVGEDRHHRDRGARRRRSRPRRTLGLSRTNAPEVEPMVAMPAA